MASQVNGLIQKINPGNGTQYSIASTAYGYCQTGADTQVKVCDMEGFTLLKGTTIHVKFQYANTASNPKLNVGGTGDKPIVQYGTTAVGTTSATSGWYAGAILSLTYDGTSWVRDQGFNSDTNTKVTQAYSTTNNSYPLLMSATAGVSSTESRGDTTAILNNQIYANPNTGTFSTKNLIITDTNPTARIEFSRTGTGAPNYIQFPASSRLNFVGNTTRNTNNSMMILESSDNEENSLSSIFPGNKNVNLGKTGNNNNNYWNNIYTKTVTLSQDPVNALEAATKQYVDGFEIPITYSSNSYQIASSIKGSDIVQNIDNCYLNIDGYGKVEIDNYLTDTVSGNLVVTIFAKGYDDIYYFGTEYTVFKITAINNNTAPTVEFGKLYTPLLTTYTNAILTSNGSSTLPSWLPTAKGAAYATSANGKLTFGTLPVGQGGTGVTSITSGNLLVGAGTGAITSIAKTSANTASTVVQRDASGNFSAGTITASLSGNATTATTLKNARTLKVNLASTSASTGFNGSANITDIGVSGTLSVGNGGTGHSSWTGNRMVWTNTAGDGLVGGYHYVDEDHVGINTATIPNDANGNPYHLYVTGKIAATSNIIIKNNARGLYLTDKDGTAYPGIFYNSTGNNLWIGSTNDGGPHHTGGTYISAGVTVDGNTTTGNKSIYVSLPNDNNNGATDYKIAYGTGGSASRPVYINSDGKTTAIDYTINKTVPADAEFTDTKVTQTETTSSNNRYAILLSSTASNDDTGSTITSTTRKASNFSYNPTYTRLRISRSDHSQSMGLYLDNSDTTNPLALGYIIGTTNGGIYDYTHGVWKLSITPDGTTTLNGTATKATQDGAGNTITSTYVKKSGDTMTGYLTYKDATINVSKANNNVSSTQYPTTFNILDSQDRIITRQEGIVSSDGNIAGFWYVRNYNTSGESLGTKGIQITMNKSGELTTEIKNSKKLTIDTNSCIKRDAIDAVTWLNGRNTALFKLNTAANYSTLWCMATSNGSWSLGHYTSGNYADSILWTYIAGNRTVNGTDAQVRLTKTGEYYATKVWGAVYNDYAEMRNVPEAQNEDNPLRPGTCVREVGDGTMIPTTERLQRGCKIISDTFGFNIGETDNCKTPIAVSGRALVYLDQDREVARDYIGWPVCSGPNGTVSIMTEEEEEKYPSRIVGTISEIPDYEKWGSSDVEVNGRIWIYVR